MDRLLLLLILSAILNRLSFFNQKNTQHHGLAGQTGRLRESDVDHEGRKMLRIRR